MEVARFEPRPVLTKHLSCSVRGCSSKSHKDLTISFHKFPRPGHSFVKIDNQKTDRFLAWKNVLEIDHVTPKMKVCSLHFLKSDYFFPEIKAQKRILKKIAVPSCNLPGDNRNEGNKASKARSKSVIHENVENSEKPNEEILFVNIKKENDDVESEGENFDTTLEFPNFETIVIKPEIHSEPFFKDAEIQVNYESPKTLVKDAEVQVNPISQFPFESFIKKTKKPKPPVKDAEAQVNTDCFIFNVIHGIHSDEELLTSTGVESFDVLNNIVQRLKEICGDKFEHPNMRLNTRDRVIMTFMKFKHNLSYSFLSILFKHYTPTHCKRIFTETVELLSKCSKDGMPWSSIKNIQKNVHKYLKNDEGS